MKSENSALSLGGFLFSDFFVAYLQSRLSVI